MHWLKGAISPSHHKAKEQEGPVGGWQMTFLSNAAGPECYWVPLRACSEGTHSKLAKTRKGQGGCAPSSLIRQFFIHPSIYSLVSSYPFLRAGNRAHSSKRARTDKGKAAVPPARIKQWGTQQQARKDRQGQDSSPFCTGGNAPTTASAPGTIGARQQLRSLYASSICNGAPSSKRAKTNKGKAAAPSGAASPADASCIPQIVEFASPVNNAKAVKALPTSMDLEQEAHCARGRMRHKLLSFLFSCSLSSCSCAPIC
eukprot:scaffold32744_cov18-Tisochrysis_lutea.AAC.1